MVNTKNVDLVIKGVKVFIDDLFIEGGVAVNNGKIISIAEEKYLPEGREIIDGKGNYLIPGTIDTHVHIPVPGHDERETFETGTKAAAAGGVTTIFEMPICIPPPYSPELLERRVKLAKLQAVVDFAMFGAAGTDKLEYVESCAKSGIIAFKTFFHKAHEGMEAEFEGLTMVNTGLQFKGLQEVSKTKKILAIHCENNDIIQTLKKEFYEKGKIDNEAQALSRPPIAEIETVSKVLLFAKETGAKIDFVHISTPESMELVKKAKLDGLEVYLETCPHYLFLTIEDLKKYGTYATSNPPLRSKEERDKLWEYINDGTVDFIGSDHSAYTNAEKQRGIKNIFDSPTGLPGIELRLPLMLTAVKKGKLSFKRAIELVSTNPAKIFGLYPKKGTIKVGSDADFVLVNMEKEFIVDKNRMFTKAHDLAIVYNGWKLTGKPLMTIVRGKVIFENDQIMPGVIGWGNFQKSISN
jgi:allantoinase